MVLGLEVYIYFFFHKKLNVNKRNSLGQTFMLEPGFPTSGSVPQVGLPDLHMRFRETYLGMDKE